MPQRKRTKCRLTDRYVRSLIPHAVRPIPYYDSDQRELVLFVYPGGRKTFSAYYRHTNRARWCKIGDHSIGVADARRLAARILLQAAEGRDAAAEKKAERQAATFASLHGQYVNLHARKRNRSWQKSEALIQRHALPRLGRMKVADVTRRDINLVLAALDERPALHNQVLASIGATFSWAIEKEIVAANPCARIKRLSVRSRERVLSDDELQAIWPGLDASSVDIVERTKAG